MKKKKDELLFYLCRSHIGADKAISGRNLCEHFDLTGSLIRKLINKLRIEGQPVCSNGNGYFYASNLKEIEETIAHLFSRSQEMMNAEAGLKKAKEKFIQRQKGGG